jgi:hypothetical protein
MVNTLILALVMALIIGVVFWAVEYMLDSVPMDNMFRRLVHIIVVLIALIVGYDRVVIPILGIFDVHLPRLF